MKIYLANPRGFCAGVDRAIDIVDLSLKKYGAPIYVRHEIVHSRHVVNSLRQKGAVFVEELSEVPEGSVVIFSAHGVAKSVWAEANQRRLHVIDATCPLVIKVHNEVNREYTQGYELILIGHAGHPEVIGTLGQIPDKFHLVSSVQDVERLHVGNTRNLSYVTQTTLSVDECRDIVGALNKRFPNIKGPHQEDICYATQNRQNASLDMLGFKSFAESRIEFPQGVTAIVGPNGSGKSNVVDAILWVLGEQSTKTLRSEKMEDVIFNGTELRKPLGMAEVSLIIGGLDHTALPQEGGLGLPSELTEYQELMITRRLYRNGDSEYLINKTACRLKDIRTLLMDTRAGSKGHTVIAQGQIDQILNASPQDRRELIEETAGIVRYKKQKAEALRKLDATQQNMLRVRDIIAEVKKQLNSLERQARQARTYQTLQQEARAIEIELLTREFVALRTGLKDVEAEVLHLDQQESEKSAGQARLATDLEQSRLRAIEIGESTGKIREELGRIEHQQAQALTAAEVARNRSQLFEQQQQQESHELEGLAAAQEEVAYSLEAIEMSLVSLEEELLSREQAFAELDQDMERLLHQRAAAVAEEERGRLDIMQLAVLVANTEQSVAQLIARMGDVSDRGNKLGAEQEELEGQRSTALIRHEALPAGKRSN
ncbi:hypothetical protein B566_EDAN000074 [Ephemera danica]|nr:hypothetical protein B566_EDAN000074 [Ephemera danica]